MAIEHQVFIPVLDFRQGRRPRNYLARQEQWRLLLLVLALGLVVVLVFEGRNPELYRRLLDGGPSGQGRSAPAGDSTAPGPIDPRPKPEAGGEELPGTFSSPGPGTPDEQTPRGYFSGVQPSLLEPIRDNKPVGPSEWDAWLHLLDLLARNDEAALREASIGQVSFVQLLDQSEEYRGQLVTTGGTIRRASPAKPPGNEYGLVDYYQTWLFPSDYPTDPIVVYCLHLPEGFPTGMQIAEQVEVTGFYFKISIYQAADETVRRTPLLLARTVQWSKKPEAAETAPPGPGHLLPLFAGAAAFAVLAAVYVYYRTRRGRPADVQSWMRRGTSRDAETAADVAGAMQRSAQSEENREP